MIPNLFRPLRARFPVRRLSLKIFLWFFLTTVGALAAVYLSGRLSGIQVVDQPNMDVTVARVLGAQVAQVYESGGPAALRRYLRSNVNEDEQEIYLVDGFYKDVLQRKIGSEGLRTVRAARDGRLVVLRGRIAAYQFTSQSGRRYVLLLYIKNGFGVLQEVLVGAASREFAGILVLVPLLCLWLAYHIASPIHAIQVAARRVAQGDLSARAPSEVLKRHDELAALGEDFNSMIERIEILLGSHKDLLAAVSHELRSPLTRLSLATALLRRGGEEERTELLDRQDRDVGLIDALIEQLVTLSRFEMGNTSGKRETVDLTYLLEQVVMDADFEATPQDKRVTFSASELVILEAADDFALRSGCENVIRNSIRFTPPGETVEVQLSLDRAPAHPEAVITISDRGPGVPENLLSKIFTPFFRISSSTVSEEGHNGLGLAIAAGAVQMHRGEVVASNRAGGGLRVVLRFPM